MNNGGQKDLYDDFDSSGHSLQVTLGINTLSYKRYEVCLY